MHTFENIQREKRNLMQYVNVIINFKYCFEKKTQQTKHKFVIKKLN